MLHNLDFRFLMTRQIEQSAHEHGLDDVPSPVLCSIREVFISSQKGRIPGDLRILGVCVSKAQPLREQKGPSLLSEPETMRTPDELR